MRKIDFSDIAARYVDYSLVQRSAGDLLLNLLDIRGNDDVLDLGCGAGNLTRKIRESTKGRVVGVDPSEGMIKEAMEKNRDLNITFEIKSAEELDYKDCFDVIFCNSTMQWFKAPEMVIKNCHTTNIFNYFKNPWFFCETSDEYKNLLEMAGFNVAFSKIDTAQEGEKIDDLKRDNRVCFEVDLPIAYVKAKNNPCEADYLYRSVIIKGRARIIDHMEEKLFALKSLMEKHQPEGNYGDYTGDKLKKVGIVRIDIEKMRGKEDIGDERMKRTVSKALEEKSLLPIVVERK